MFAQGLLRRACDVFVFYLWQIELLGTKHRARSCNSDPPNEGLSWYLEMLHSVNSDQSARSAKAGFAMYRNRTRLRIREVRLAPCHKLIYYVLGWHGTVNKYKVFVLNSALNEGFCFIFGIIKSDNFSHV